MEQTMQQHIKGYELRERLGAGGFGAVYRAYQSTVGREVAIKVILPSVANHPDFIRRFETEAQVIARLEHLHIVPLYDYWRDPEGAYLVMRWLKGGSLRDALENGAFDLNSTLLLMDQITSALDAAHRNGIIHRDLKPANILLDEDGNAYLADFGIAKDLTNTRGSNTAEDVIVGSLDYISPEQARSEPVTSRTDIYSLGVVLYEALTGHHPFPNLTPVERLYHHLNDPLPIIDNPMIPPQVNEVIQKATAKNPAHRYADSLEFAAAFRQAAAVDGKEVVDNLAEALTLREHEILLLLIQGLSNKEIAQKLTFTHGTVRWYINQIYKKLHVRSRVQAIIRARELNLITTHITADELPTVLGAVPIPTSEFQPENPYKGLRAFKAVDHEDYFGQEKLIDKLLKRIGEAGDNARFLAVIGPSGSGKSSLVKAGLIPAIWRGELPSSERWFVAEMLPGSHPLDELEIALTQVAANQTGNLREHLQRDERGLIRAAQLILPDDGSDLVIVIDQFEEIFTLVEDETARVHFLDLIHSAVSDPRSRIRIIITLRADFYDRPLHYPDFGELVRSRMETILPLSAEGLERAIRRPAERVGVSFEEGLVAAIIQEIHYQPGALPLLQYALTELFEQRQGRMLTHEAYQAIGKTTGALAKRAEQIYAELTPELQETVRQMFLRLVTLGEGAEDTRRRIARSELLAIASDSDMVDEIIDTFAEYRLLSLDHDPTTRTPTVEVAHEAILREWERLRNWLNESRSEIRLQRQLAHATQEWFDSQQDASFLLRGTRLELFEKWAGETQLVFTSREKNFLQASLKQREKEQLAEQERQAREVRLEQRSQNFLRGLVAVFAVATAIAISLSVFAFGQRNRAEKAQLDAEDSAEYARSLALASAAKSSYLSDNPDQAIALAVAANTATDNPPAFAQSVLYQTAFAPATRRLLLVSNSARLSPDGSGVLSWQWGESSLSHWDTETGQVIYQTSPLVEEGSITDILFSQSGETAWVAIATSDNTSGTVIEIDVASGREIRRLTLPDGRLPIGPMALSPDEQILLTSSATPTEDGTFVEGSIYAFDTASGSVIRQFAETPLNRPYELRSLGLSPDGQQVAAGYSTGAVILWDVTTGEVLRTFEGVTNGIDDVHITTEGIAANSVQIDAFTQTLTLWDMETGTLLRQKVWNTVGNETALHPDGHSIALTFMGAPVTIFDVQTWETTREFYGHGSIQYTADFSSDGRWLLTGSVDNELRLWNMEDGSELKRMSGLNNNQLVGLIRSPDGRTALSQQLNGPLTLWDIETGTMLRQWGNTNMSFTGTAFSPDGRYIVSGTSEDPDLGTCPPPEAKLTLWDAATGEMIWEVETNGNATTGKAFINGGSQIATVDRWCGNNVTIWDVATGQRVAEWEGHQEPAWGLAASPDGKTIVTASEDSTAIIWDAATGLILQVLPHNYVVRTGAFSPDGQRLVTVTNDGILHLWDANTWQELKQLAGHSSSILFVQFSPDSRYVVSSGRDNNVFVWDLQTGEAVRHFELPSVGAWGHVVIFSPDSQSLFMNIDNTVIRQKNLMLEPGELLDWVYANRYVRELTCSERTLYDLEPEKCAG